MIKIETAAAPAAIGPYSQAYRVDNFLFVSGQTPINPLTVLYARTLRHRPSRAAKMSPPFWRQPVRTLSMSLRRPASLPTWPTLPPSTACTQSTSPPSPPAAASPCVSYRRACCARSRPLHACKIFPLLPYKSFFPQPQSGLPVCSPLCGCVLFSSRRLDILPRRLVILRPERAVKVRIIAKPAILAHLVRRDAACQQLLRVQ